MNMKYNAWYVLYIIIIIVNQHKLLLNYYNLHNGLITRYMVNTIQYSYNKKRKHKKKVNKNILKKFNKQNHKKLKKKYQNRLYHNQKMYK